MLEWLADRDSFEDDPPERILDWALGDPACRENSEDLEEAPATPAICFLLMWT